MYKCSVCSKQYKIKPDFCDCGNSEFIEIKEAPIRKRIERSSQNKQSSEQNKKNKNTGKQNLISIIIFLICILLSILSIFLLGNEFTDNGTEIKEEINKEIKTVYIQQKKVQPAPIVADVPVQKQPVQVAQAAPTKTEPIKQEVPKQPIVQKKQEDKTAKQKTEDNTKKVKTNTQTTKKADDKSKKTTLSNKPKTTQTASQPVQTVQQETPKQKVVNAQQLDMLKPVLSEKEIEQRKKELAKYKIALRNKIASNINFGAIVGDGDCTITFKISKKGEITNRSFSKLSKNGSLNDNVYIGMMKTPAYNPPPEQYKNETLKLYVRMYGGKFEVSLN